MAVPETRHAGSKALVMLAAIGAATAAGIAGATQEQRASPTTFSVTRVQAQEIAAVVGFIHAYNHADLKAALTYLAKMPRSGQSTTTATDCDYRRRTTKVYVFRRGFKRWLKQRFADHDRLTFGRILDKNPAQPIGVVGVEYARRQSDTLRKLGYPKGIVPQIAQKLPFVFKRGVPKFPVFGLASTPPTATPNPECALVAAH